MMRRSIGVLMVSMSLAFSSSSCQKSEPPAGTSKEASSGASAPDRPKPLLVPRTQLVDWCGEHGVPESQCTRCNPALVDGFKKKGDWCGEHNLPKSQCIACDPALEAKLKAMAPKADGVK